MSEYHTPVMLDESITALITNPQGTYADCTFGGGGHTAEILSRLQDGGRVIAFDRDSDALANAPDDSRLTLVHNNFRFIENYAELLRREEPGKRVFSSEPMATLGHVRGRGPACREGSERSEDGSEGNTLLPGTPEVFDGILADLGVSSHQFDTAERGFSFRYDAPLDMRMGRESSITAADIVNTRSQEDLERILRLYGEVDGARNIARLIVAAREKEEIRTTGDLDRAIEKALPKMAAHKQLAKIYQALRIEVNQEMRSLEKFLDGAARCLKPGGHLLIRGVDKYDCWELKMIFGGGQGWNDPVPVSITDYENVIRAGFRDVILVPICERDYFNDREAFKGFLSKVPILENAPDDALLDEYIARNTVSGFIRLQRWCYGITARK